MPKDKQKFEAWLNEMHKNKLEKEVKYSDEELNDQDAIQLCQTLLANTTLMTLDLSLNKIGAIGSCALSSTKNLSMLNLCGNQAGDIGAIALSKNNTLTTLDLRNNQIGDLGAKALSFNKTLTALYLYGNQMGEENEQAIDRMLERNRSKARDFFQACQTGNLSKVKELLLIDEVSPYVLEYSYDDCCPRDKDRLYSGLHCAVFNEQAEIARYLATHFHHLLSCRDREGNTPLMLAEKKNDLEMIAILKDRTLSEKTVSLEVLVDITRTLSSENYSQFEPCLNEIRENKTGKEEKYSNEKLNDQYIMHLCQALSLDIKQTILHLNFNHVSDVGASVLSTNNTLTTLSLCGNQISDIGAISLSKNKTLTTLDLSLNQISDAGASALSMSKALTSLGLYGNQIGDVGAIVLATNQILIRLDLKKNRIGAEGARAFAKNTTLNMLDLRENKIGIAGAIALLANTRLTKFDLKRNKIDDEGVKALSANKTLITLNLEDNKIGDDGVKVLSKNKTLITLNLMGNNISDEAVRVLSVNTTLIALNLNIHCVSNKNKRQINKMLERNRQRAREFLQACQNGHLFKVKELLLAQQVSPYVFERSYDGFNPKDTDSLYTSLHFAVLNKRYEVAHYLVENYSHLLQFRDKENQTALMLAEKQDDQEMIVILKDKEINKQIAFFNREETEKKVTEPSFDVKARSVSQFNSFNYVISHADLYVNTNDKSTFLGGGGSGQVYRGSYHSATVAVKQFLIDDSFPDDLFTEFKQEAAIMAQLRHPNIVHFYGMTDSSPYRLVMEFASQGSLYGLLHSKKELAWEQCQQWTIEIGTGLHYLHENKILHRDLKSLNVLVGGDNVSKLTDFGLAMMNIRSATQTISKTNSHAKGEKAVGSLRWMAPELLGTFKPRYSSASDMFAFAIVMWEIASREMPYKNVPWDSEIVSGIKNGDREEIPETCPVFFAKLITQCWAEKPEDRLKVMDVVNQLHEASTSKEVGSNFSAAVAISASRGYASNSIETVRDSSLATAYQF